MSGVYDTTARVLDAAAEGRTVPGHEAVGRLLVEVARTEAVPAGAAIRSSAVAAATAATPTGWAASVASFVRPVVWLVAVAGIGLGAGLALRGPETVETKPADGGVARTVTTSDPVPSTPFDLTTTTSGDLVERTDPTSTVPATGEDAPTAAEDGAATAAVESTTSASTPTVVPSTSGPDPEPPTSTIAAPGSSTTSPPTTTIPTTTTTWGNNGNGNSNGNGVGNGDGNQSGNGNGSGGNGNGANGGGPPGD